MAQFKKFLQLTKVNEAERLVTGIMLSEAPDFAGEVMDYTSTKPYVEAWSNELSKATNGENLGNVREMHGSVAAGMVKSIDYDDDAKTISVTVKIVDDSVWNKVLQKVYTGFSIGGKYIKKWADKANAALKRYTGKPAELSVVDAPCNPEAYFTLTKANGEVERVELPVRPSVVTILGEALPALDASALADLSKRIHDAYQVETALAPELDDDDRQAERLLAKGAEVVDLANALNGMLGAEKLELQKDLWSVSDMAMLLNSLRRIMTGAADEAMMEGDNSPVPAKLQAAFRQLAEVFLEMAAEEVDEAVALKLAAGDLQKRADEQLVKMQELTTERDELQKRFDAQAAELVAEKAAHELLKAKPAPVAGPLYAVDKTTEVQQGTLTKEEEEAIALKKSIDAMPEGEEKVKALLKLQYRAGPMQR